MIKVRQVKISINNNDDKHILNKLSNILRINPQDIISYKINRRSIDARDKNNILYIYEFLVEVTDEDKVLKNKSQDILKHMEVHKEFNITGTKKITSRPIVIGFGPSGMFLSYMLAKYGYKPLIFERGDEISKRIEKVESFWKTGKLDENTNVQFGEGGAGTFSDGKLNTLVKDKGNIQEEIFKIFVECGADESIMYDYKPHIGTDILRKVTKNLREKIISMGGEIHFNSRLTDIITHDGKIKEIVINDKEKLNCESLFLCLGHSARDTFLMLNSRGIEMMPKPFAVGIRIIHDEEKITNSMYGTKKLGPASYKLTYATKSGRGVYSFCMCPGGYVVNASSKNNYLSINGMSDFKRDSLYSNSAIVCQVSPKDYGENLFDGMNFQESLEKNAYNIGSGLIPLELYKDYKLGTMPKEEFTTHKGIKGHFKFANVNEIFPYYINETIKEGIEYFGTKIKGFNDDDSIILGVESRTSSPVKINRSDSGESNIKGIYPVGEGAGYAGGITTSAMDGIKTFEKYIKEYKP